jgi:hypothetical protein
MKLMDYEAGQAELAFKIVVLTHVGFLTAIGGASATLVTVPNQLQLCTIPFLVGIILIFIGRRRLTEELRVRAKQLADDTPNIDETKVLADIELADVWAHTFRTGFRSDCLKWSRLMLGVGILILLLVLVFGDLKFK